VTALLGYIELDVFTVHSLQPLAATQPAKLLLMPKDNWNILKKAKPLNNSFKGLQVLPASLSAVPAEPGYTIM